MGLDCEQNTDVFLEGFRTIVIPDFPDASATEQTRAIRDSAREYLQAHLKALARKQVSNLVASVGGNRRGGRLGVRRDGKPAGTPGRRSNAQ